MDSMMVTTNPYDPQSNFTGPNALKENTMPAYPVTTATEALRRAESVSRKLRRAQRNLEAAIKDLDAAGYDTQDLKVRLDIVIEHRNVARVKRELARDVLKEAAIKKIAEGA